MTETADSPPPKPSKLPLLLGLGLALILGGAGFWAMFSGLLLSDPPHEPAPGVQISAPAPAGSYLPIDPITINLGQRGQSRHLRFVAQMEVVPAHAAEVGRLMPRIVDVLNTYLRAVDLPELEEPAALTRLRAQMLRRIQIVTGPGRVNDLLIMEFIFN
jgi:flagellar FliL protein